MAKRTNDPDGMRRRITEAAFELFTRDGYNATAMHQVRDLAGVSSGAFAHHFPSKHGLGLAVIRERVAEAIEDTWIKPVASARSARAGVHAVFEQVIAELDGNGSVSGCPLGNLAAELSTQGSEFRSELHGIFQRWASAIRTKLAVDGYTRDEGAAMASFVVSAFSGAMLQAKAEQSSAPLRLNARLLNRLLAPAARQSVTKGKR